MMLSSPLNSSNGLASIWELYVLIGGLDKREAAIGVRANACRRKVVSLSKVYGMGMFFYHLKVGGTATATATRYTHQKCNYTSKAGKKGEKNESSG